MLSEQRKIFAKMLLDNAITWLKPGETMELASGRVISGDDGAYYADLRLLSTRPSALPMLAEAYHELVPTDVHYIGAVPTGGLIPLGALGYLLALMGHGDEFDLFYIRPKPKGHGGGQAGGGPSWRRQTRLRDRGCRH